MRVIGIGNPLRGDDAAGLLVARRVREIAPAQVEVIELEGEPARLIDAWQGADIAVVVDAVSSGAAAGELMRFDAGEDPLPASVGAPSTHALGLGDAVEIARALGRLPRRLIVFGIEAAEFTPGSAPSGPVASAIGPAAEAVLREQGAVQSPPTAK